MNFLAKINLFDFDIQTGMSKGYLFCPSYHINNIVEIDYPQFQYLLGLCGTLQNKYTFYAKMINNNVFVIDRCFVNAIINHTFGK